jgi:hypothetical protein
MIVKLRFVVNIKITVVNYTVRARKLPDPGRDPGKKPGIMTAPFSRYTKLNVSAPPAPSRPCSPGKAGTAALIIGKLSRRFSPVRDGYVTVEYVTPGDHRASTNRNEAPFVRRELQWKISGDRQPRTPTKWPLGQGGFVNAPEAPELRGDQTMGIVVYNYKKKSTGKQ